MDSISERARQSMRQRRYDEAIALYDMQLEQSPDDRRSLMELGICHLLNGSDGTFLRIYHTLKERMADSTPLQTNDRALWDYYLSLARKVTAAVLVIGSVAAAGCREQNNSEVHTATNTQPAGTNLAHGAPTTNSPKHFSAHRYSAGVFMEKKQVDPPAGKSAK